MSALANTCMAAITKAIDGRIDIDELEAELEAISDTISLTREKSGDIPSAVSRVSNDLIKSVEHSALIEKRNAYKNMLTEREAFAQVDAAIKKFKGNKKGLLLGLRSILVGINTPIPGAQRSAYGMSQALKSEYMGQVVDKLRKADLLPTFQKGMKGDFEVQVAAAMKHLNSKNAQGNVPRVGNINSAEYSKAIEIARIFSDTQEKLRLRLNRAGSDIAPLDGFIGHQIHDQSKMLRAGFEKWKATIAPLLDWDSMKIPLARRDEFLDSAYHAMASGIRKELGKSTEPLALGFKGPSNLARSLSHSRLLHFKEAKGWVEYGKQFGGGGLRENLMQDISMSTKNIGTLERLTTNPEVFVDNLISAVERKYRTSDFEAAMYLKDNKDALKRDLDVVTGAINIGSHTNISKIGEWVRAIKTMATLGGSFLSALTDISFNATNRMYHGRNIFEAWGDAFMSPLQRLGSKERKHVSDLLGTGLDMQIGSFMSRYSADDYMHGATSGMLNTYFKWNLLGPWTDSVKAGATMMLSRDLAMVSSKSFDNLSVAHKRLLDIYSIDAKQWNVMRLASKQAEDGRTYILPGDIDDVSGSVFNGMSKFQQRKLKEQARENLFLLYSSEADFAAPTPGGREQSLLKMGTTPNTAIGQALRLFTQFKAFPITALTKVGGRAAYGGGGNMQMVNLIVGSTMMGAAVVQLKEMAKGREPMDMGNSDFFIKAGLQGGAFGLYGDFLLNKHSEYGGSLVGTMAGPIPADLEKILTMGQDVLLNGDTSNLGRDGVKLLKGITPYSNLFYSKMAMDYMIWYQMQELVNPGYVQRMERNMKNRTGQEYMDMPIFGTPTGTVSRGGGFN